MGVYKSINRIALEAEDFDKLIRLNSYKQIANRFEVSITLVHEVARLHFELKDVNNFEGNQKEVEFLGTKGAWNELKSTPLYKQIMYGRN
jgi:hypothetical protein